jgi:flagellar biosynthetic protein FlhB
MAESTGDKTHDPTPRRRQQARESGRVAQSHDLTSAALLLAAIALLAFTGNRLFEFLCALLRESLGGGTWRSWMDARDAGGQLVVGPFRELAGGLAALVLPVLAGAALVAVAVGSLQTGFLLLPQRIVPDWSRSNPLAGLRRMFSGTSFARLAMGVFKVGVVAAIAWSDLWGRRDELALLVALEPGDLAVRAGDLCLSTCLKLGGALLALAAVDYLFERWRLERELAMSPQEVREELRELGGHRQIIERRRRLSSAMAAGNRDHPAAGAGAGRQ